MTVMTTTRQKPTARFVHNFIRQPRDETKLDFHIEKRKIIPCSTAEYESRTHVAICKLKFPAVCVYCCSLVCHSVNTCISFFRKSRDFVMFSQKRKLFFDFSCRWKSIIARRSPTVRLRSGKKSFACVDGNWISRRIVDKWSHRWGFWWWSHEVLMVEIGEVSWKLGQTSVWSIQSVLEANHLQDHLKLHFLPLCVRFHSKASVSTHLQPRKTSH